jgi:hypothetical protein
VPKKNGFISKLKELILEAAKLWIPLEERNREKIIEGNKTKIPRKVILSVMAITVSLLMIVSSVVLLSTARKESSELKDEIEELDFQIAELKTELNKKNEGLDIEFYAQEVLGMINKEHVNAEYISSNKTDGVVKSDYNKASLTSLIEWFFQQFK